MSDASFKMEGMEELIDTLKELPINISKNVLRGAVFQGAKTLADAVRARAPIGTPGPGHKPGGLRKSIIAKRGGKISDDGVAIANVRGVFYGRMLEYGTSKMPPHPWIRAVFDQETQNILKAVGEGFKNSFEKVIKRAAKKLNRG